MTIMEKRRLYMDYAATTPVNSDNAPHFPQAACCFLADESAADATPP